MAGGLERLYLALVITACDFCASEMNWQITRVGDPDRAAAQQIVFVLIHNRSNEGDCRRAHSQIGFRLIPISFLTPRAHCCTLRI